MRIPKPLFPGARVALVAPSSPVREDRLPKALELVRSLGLEPVVFPSCYFDNRHGYFSARDDSRAADVNRAFADPDIDGVWCVRGGCGGHRILPLLDGETIRRNPKWFGGYSDVTALHLYLNQDLAMETYHCPMPASNLQPDAYTRTWLEKALFGGLTGPVAVPADRPLKPLAPGRAEGRLCGGNLSLLAASMGTPWEVDTRGKILFLEDIGEKPYRIDGMLTQLRNGGKLRDCAGVLLGDWTDCDAPEDSLTLEQIFEELLVPAGKPVLMGLACGHGSVTGSLPLGRKCRMDAGNGTIILLED